MLVCVNCKNEFRKKKGRKSLNQKFCNRACCNKYKSGISDIDGKTFKRCPRCERQKETLEFYKSRDNKSGFSNACKTCTDATAERKAAAMPTGICGCGCGEITTVSKKRPSGLPPLFKAGHHARVVEVSPDPSIIPSGLCECGCGEKTETSTRTNSKQRRFRGFPLPFVKGHEHIRRLERHSQWKGGRSKNEDGYILMLKPKCYDNGRKSRYVLEHRYVMEQKLGRVLLPSENVHHINGNIEDNRIENLELWVKTQPCGQRVEDIINFSLEMLKQYAPEILNV